ncbi:MAG TPA: sugar ABC transporter ATP-binding protein [Herpetosiphonaceae bacterium]|nr:sugar ABC transporter ATP-binding protein [Herpetosiphonaceae bacterium]
MGQTEQLLQMENITKTFPGVLALQNASLHVGRGEIHALIGQNGAGKSTLIKILTGAYRRTSGSISFDGAAVDFASPHQAQASGLSTIYQEVNLIPFRTVSENIFMGREPRRWGLIRWSRMNRAAAELLERFGVGIDVTRPLMSFNIAVQQMVAVARAVSFQSKLVVMDEPTSSLDEREVATLFDVMRQLKAEGVSVVFVSHRLDELYAVCDRVTIMRDGRTISNQALADVPRLDLVAQMLGPQAGPAGGAASPPVPGGPRPQVIAAAGLRRGRAIQGVDLEVSGGEIVGLAGLLGSGRTEVARVLFGADPADGGELLVGGKPARFRQPADAIRQGIGFCSEDRKTEGIIPYLSVRDNLTLALLPALTRRGVIARERQRAIVEQFIARLGIKTAGPDQPIRELSGGNQQKVLLARWLCMNPQLLILDEPTRGIDIGAKGEIQRLIRELADAGLGVVMIASELEELIADSDRVVVLRDGQSVDTLERGQISAERIMGAMAQGASRRQEEEVRHG